MAKVGIVMGSDSDMPVMAKAAEILDKFGIDYEMTIISAHREPDVFFDWAKSAEEKGFKVIIAGAGKAAHLPGMCAAIFPLPVIGIPMKTSDLGGVDSLYSIVQMPSGIPVATVAINGGQNAGILAAKILAASDGELLGKLKNYSESLKNDVVKKAEKLESIGYKEYLAQMKSSEYHNLLIEKFIEGEAYQINALYLQGKPIFISASRATVSCLDFLSGQTLGLVMEDDNPLHQKLIDYTKYLAKEVFPIEKNTLLHLEVFVDQGGNIIFGELACRLGGCFVNEELGAAFGLDPRMTWLKACLNETYPRDLAQRIPVIRVGQLNVPPSQGTLQAIADKCPLPFVINYRATGVVGRHYDVMKLTNGEIVSAIVEGESSREIEEHLAMLTQWVIDNTHWVKDTVH